MELILKNLKRGFQNVVEFRDSSWWDKKIYKSLEENEIIFCSVNHPKLPDDLIINSGTSYIRLHGNPQIFYSKYSDKELKKLFEEVNKKRKVKEVYIYFNNTASTAGVLNAIELQSLISI